MAARSSCSSSGGDDRRDGRDAGAAAGGAGAGHRDQRGAAFPASFGVADTSAGATLDEIIQAADGALLRAKQLGRDRVVVAGAADDDRHAGPPAAAEVATPAG
jgi:hypothetical protein